MRQITQGTYLAQKSKDPRRRIFSEHSGIHLSALGSTYFKPPFPEGIKHIFEADTGFRLKQKDDPDNCFLYLDEFTIEAVRAWENARGTIVFLRDCLSCSIALGKNRPDTTAAQRTPLGELEYRAKSHACEASTQALADALAAAIVGLPLYRDTRLIAAVPPRPGKTSRDLPSELVRRVSARLGLTDLTPHFTQAGERGQVKALTQDERWQAWEGAGLTLDEEGAALLSGNPIILLDDKYQSGASANFVAMVLQRHGAAEVYGLYTVKTMRDTDNT